MAGGLNVSRSSHRQQSTLTGPANRRIVSVLSGVVPTHPVASERVPYCSYSESQLVGADRMAGIGPHLAARMRSRERIDAHVQGAGNFRRVWAMS